MILPSLSKCEFKGDFFVKIAVPEYPLLFEKL